MAVLRFQDLLREARRQQVQDLYNTQAQRWYRYLIERMKLNWERTSREPERYVQPASMLIGRMYVFGYRTPVPASTLPYYDRFPLVIPLRVGRKRMLGMNLHYLDPLYRAILFDNLLPFLQPKPAWEASKLQVTYDMLSSAARYKMFRPTVHTYRADRITTTVLKVPTKEWVNGLFLPFARWQRGNSMRTWKDSRSKFL